MMFWENVKKAGIQQAGKERGWIRKLAEKCGIHEVELGNKIRKNTNVNVHDASRIAAALDTTIEALLSDGLLPAAKSNGRLQAHTTAVNKLKEIIQKYIRTLGRVRKR